MKKTLLFCGVLSALLLAACGNPATNGNSNNANASKSNSNSANANTGAKTEKKETKLPAGKAPVPVPADWVTLSDSSKGYEFQVPAGTQGQSQTADNGVDVYLAKVPAPYDLGVAVLAFKDKTASKDDLIKSATAVLEKLGDKDVKVEALTELSDDYSVATYTSTSADGKKSKGKFLVATDVTDNYIVLVGGDDAKFADNEKTVDAIWGSFTMYSGGYSNN